MTRDEHASMRLRKLEAVAEAAAAVLAERIEPDGARGFLDPRSDAKERLSIALSALDAPLEKEHPHA